MKKSINNGFIAGVIFGILDIIPMFFMDGFADKNSAIIGGIVIGFIEQKINKE